MNWDAVLLDLDGTLLDVDMSEFLPAYLTHLAEYLAPLVDAERFPAWLMASTRDVLADTRSGRTNEQVFWESFEARSGVARETLDQAVRNFYRGEFSRLVSLAAPMPGAAELVAAARAHARWVALATNPIFPAAAVHERVRWAGLDPDDFDLITSYENMHACKPQAEYYREILGMLEIEDPQRALMVGDDPVMDMAAGAAGIRTFLVDGAPGGGDDIKPAPGVETAWLTAAGIDVGRMIRRPGARGDLTAAVGLITGRKSG